MLDTDGEVPQEASLRFDSNGSVSNTVEERRVCQYLKRIQCGNVEALAALNTLQWARVQRCARITPELVSAILAEVEQDIKREGKGSAKAASGAAGDWEHLCALIRDAAGVAHDHADLCAGACSWRRAMRDCCPELLALGSWLLLLVLEQAADCNPGDCCSTASSGDRSWSLSIMLIVLILAAAVLVAQHALRWKSYGKVPPGAASADRSTGEPTPIIPTSSGDGAKTSGYKSGRESCAGPLSLPGLSWVVHGLLLLGGVSWLAAHIVAGDGSRVQVYLGAATIYTLMSLASARAALWVTLRRRLAREAAAVRKEGEPQAPSEAWPKPVVPASSTLCIQIPRQVSGPPSNDGDESEPLLALAPSPVPSSPRQGTGSFVHPGLSRQSSMCSNAGGRNSLTPAWAASGALMSPRTSARGSVGPSRTSTGQAGQTVIAELALSRALTMESIAESAGHMRTTNGGCTTRKWKPLFRDPTFNGRFKPLSMEARYDSQGSRSQASATRDVKAFAQIPEDGGGAGPCEELAEEEAPKEPSADRTVSLMSGAKELHPWQVDRDGAGASPLGEGGNAVKLPSFGTIALPKAKSVSGGSNCGGSNVPEDGDAPSPRSPGGSSSGGLSDVSSNAGSRTVSPGPDSAAAAKGSSASAEEGSGAKASADSSAAGPIAEEEARRSVHSDGGSSDGAFSDVSTDGPKQASVNKPPPVPKAMQPKVPANLLLPLPPPKKNSAATMPTMAEVREDEEEEEESGSGFSDVSEGGGQGQQAEGEEEEEEPEAAEDEGRSFDKDPSCLLLLDANEDLFDSDDVPEETVLSPPLSTSEPNRSQAATLSLPRSLPPLEAASSPRSGADDESPAAVINKFAFSTGARTGWVSEEASDQERDLSGDGGVLKKTLREGTGNHPAAGETVFVHYTGCLADGTVFDTSRGKPHRAELGFYFLLGGDEVIRGWDVGCAAMRIGERANLTCRADYGYGPTGAGSVVPPGATLVFDVELLDSRRLAPGDREALDARIRAARG